MAYFRRYTPRSNAYYNTQSIVRDTAPQFSEQELADPTLDQRISKVLGNNDISDWEKDFLQSIFVYFAGKKRLSVGQYATLKKIEDKHSETALAKKKEFADNFTEEKRNDIRIVAGIYRETHSPYHKALVDLVLEKDGFIPSATQWERLMENKYAQGYLQNAKSIAKYNIGDTVTPSSLGKHFTWTHAIIIDNAGILPHTHAVGGKRYSILPYGEMNTCFVEEREIKKSR